MTSTTRSPTRRPRRVRASSSLPPTSSPAVCSHADGRALRPSLAAVRLAELVTGAELARALDVTKQAASFWLTGRSIPSFPLRIAIAERWGVPATDWSRLPATEAP